MLNLESTTRKLIRACILGSLSAALLCLPLCAGAGEDDQKKTCPECHKGIADQFKGEIVHEPFGDGTCNECHQFHEFIPRTELRGRIFDICTGCHEDISADMSEDDAHTPVTEDRSCINCHMPHRSDQDKLLIKPAGELCMECHDPPSDSDGQIHEPYGKLQCVVCHDPHGTIFSAYLRLPAGLLCIECHKDLLPGYGPFEMHSSDDLKSCENCHGAHSGIGPNLLVRAGSSLCLGCHREMADVADRKYAHEAVTDGNCTDCHVPHFQKGRSSLARLQRDLCGDCHDLEDAEFGRTHMAMTPVDCAGCHDPHGGATEHFLRPFLHDPFAERECDTCHADATSRDALRSPELCESCHEIATEGGHAADKVDKRVCVDCHSPHAGTAKYFLR